jgi:histidine phosphotransferase ChpT
LTALTFIKSAGIKSAGIKSAGSKSAGEGGKFGMRDIDLAALLCSRLCHDLVSPVGAMANGVEILAEEQDEDMRTEVIKLLEHSARQTSNRLQFFRMAFGAGAGFGQMVGLRDAEKAVVAYFDGSRVSVDWQPKVTEVRKEALKVMLNLILVAGEAIIRDGKLVVTAGAGPDGLRREVRAEAERLTISEQMVSALKGEIELSALDSKTAPAYLATQAAGDLGGRIELDLVDPKSYSLRLLAPEI